MLHEIVQRQISGIYNPAHETINKELNFEISQNGNYTISEGKKVEIYNEEIKDDEYIRVKFVPCWISESDEFICANLQGISDFYGQSLNDQKNKLIVYNSFGEEIITYILNGNWQSNWIYNETDSCFYHKGVLKTGDSSVLLENVEISPDVAELAEGYKLKIDILADAVQQYGNVSDNRNNENWRISYE